MMKSIAENVIEDPQQADVKNNDICPSLILAETVMCDALEQLYRPSSRQIRECCANEHHKRCTLLCSV